jgi:NAD(P)-dependent dehydrogenase (short-subunit alcohol dehydrogenase family)
MGVHLGLCARSEPAPRAGARGLTRAVDVTDAAALDRFARDVTAELGPIDLWLNNAGVLEPMGPLRTLESIEIHRALLVNVGGVANEPR